MTFIFHQAFYAAMLIIVGLESVTTTGLPISALYGHGALPLPHIAHRSPVIDQAGEQMGDSWRRKKPRQGPGLLKK
ncbi:hypothetical protein FVF58_25250 [Paraburkholderia panacisoli]|uniref:Uncharacterized protein n=1 Tax=Paraburkholderia panacisoli TaxID=2603818 RepID=A0A5B0GVD2_9BURK|nr:hypothetical protein [Paraburkholderia panacisoli]KAA1006860.1 hypothetical protein FVF58_25250 [Paraburkholderia panacisoli]